MVWDFFIENWLGILVVIFFMVYVIYLTVTKQWTKVRELAYEVMLIAERNFKDDEGKLKFDFVVKIVYKNIPVWLKIFVNEEDIRSLIENWYQLAKDYLDDGEINNSIQQIIKANKTN